MAINNVSVQYNGRLLPDIILLTQCYYHNRGTHLTKRFDVFPPDRGMLRRSRCDQIFFKYYYYYTPYSTLSSALHIFVKSTHSTEPPL